MPQQRNAYGEIKTARLQLRPYTPDQLLALIEGVPQFEKRMGLRAADGLRDFFVSDEVSPAWLESLRASQSADPWVFGFAVVDHANPHGPVVIGAASYKGPPDADGVVEIAYGIVPTYEGFGYATEVAAALVAFAFDSGAKVRLVRAHTQTTGYASIRVLEKCGFERIGEFMDPEDGLVLRWERRKS